MVGAMSATDSLIPGVAVWVIALGVGLLLAWMTIKFSRGRSMVMAMVQTSFLPEKRQRFLVLMSVQGALLLLTAIVWGLTLEGVIPALLGNTATAALLIGGIGTVGALTWLGYAPTRLTSEQRRSLASQAPELFRSLVMAPLQLDVSGMEFSGHARTRTPAAAMPRSSANAPPRPPSAPP
jgi:hypothetical protein